MQLIKNLFASTCLLLLVACGSGVTGTWMDDAGVTRYAFSRNGSVTISVLGSDVDAEYRMDGDKILVSSAQGTVVLTQRDGDLYGPMGLRLIRQPDQTDKEKQKWP
jgi:hypothetical protein